MSEESDTPETILLWNEVIDHFNQRDECVDPYHVKLADLAEKLERERDKAIHQRGGLHKLHNDNSKRHAELLELCGTLRQERDEARRELAAARQETPLRETPDKLDI